MTGSSSETFTEIVKSVIVIAVLVYFLYCIFQIPPFSTFWGGWWNTYGVYLIIAIIAIIVIVGGLGSLKGTMVAALIICPLESVMTLFVTPTEARVISFLVMAAVLLVRPQGLFKAWR